MPGITPRDAQTPLILTLDIGTSSVRALLFDARARLIDGMLAQEQYDVHLGNDGAAEDDPDEVVARVERCIDGVFVRAGALSDAIGAVALDTLVSNILPVDAAGRPLGPLITYADTRNAEDALRLRQQLDERAVHERTGCLLRTSYWPARLAWFKRTRPHLWSETAHWMTIGEYLEQRLFGRSRVSYSVASWSGLLDRHRLTWDAPLLDALELPDERVGVLADTSEPLKGLRDQYARRWPALSEVPWYPAIGDGAAANIGSGCTNATRLAITVGTTGALRLVLPGVPQMPRGLWCYRVDRRRALLGGATSEGGNVYAWMQRTLRLGDPANVEREVAAIAPDSHGLTMLPLLAGERSPGWAGDVRATITGLTLSTTPQQLVRAGLEAIAYRFALIDRLICAEVGAPHSAIASGGALLRSPAWMQIIADVLGRSLTASAEPEATSRGVALLALESLGVIDSIDDLPADVGAVYEPNQAHHERYVAAIERQQQLYSMLIEQ